MRCGHAYAHGYDMHKNDVQVGGGKYKRKAVLSSFIYGLGLPGLLVLSFSGVDGQSIRYWDNYCCSRSGNGVGILSAGFLQDRRIEINGSPYSRLYAGFILLGKFPEVQGVLHYYLNKALGKTSKIIEYKVDSKET